MKTIIAVLVLAISLLSPAPAAELQEKDAEVFGFNIHYAEAGSGPPLILLHGLWGGTNEWLPIIGPLSESNRIIAMDFIGFHGSDKPEARYHNALLSQFLAGFIDELDLENVILMGHAMGANSATYTAVHHAQNIAGLILVDGAGYRNPDRDLSQPPGAGMLKFMQTATGSNLASTRGLLERRVADKTLVTDEWVAQAFSMWLKSAGAIRDMLREGGDVTAEEMRRISIPTMIVWGAADQVFSMDNATRLQSDIENSKVAVIEDSGHLPQLEQTEAFLAAIRPFLKQTGSSQ